MLLQRIAIIVARARQTKTMSLILLFCVAQILLASISGIFSRNVDPLMQQQASQQSTCAAHIPPSSRKVLFIRMPTMKKFYEKFSKKGGEYYVYACLDYALRQNGFEVEMTNQHLGRISEQELRQYHRIFLNGIEEQYYQLDVLRNNPDILCKLRPLHFFGNWRPEPPKNNQTVVLNHRQILSPYQDVYNTFMGYFVHSLLYDDGNKEERQLATPTPRPKKGLIVGKIQSLFNAQHYAIMEALIAEGYTLYSVCKDLTHHCGMPPQVIVQRSMAPKDYAALMGEMAFLIGFGDPVVSPSPLEGLAHGAAWLNAIKDAGDATANALQEYPLAWNKPTSPIHTQHNPLALLGMPYVYNIDLKNVSNVLQAAEWAVQYRFTSYTPPEFRPEAMVARACGLMEDDSLCSCPKDVPGMDCHASSYVRNMPM